MTRHLDVATVLLVLALLLGAIALDLSGHTILVVSGASMEPAIAKGSLLVVRPALPTTLAVGDVVTYQRGGRTVTHRISAVEAFGGTPAFSMKGDANTVADPEPVAFDDRAGLLVAHVPLAGYVLGLLQAYGRLLSLALAVLIGIRLIARHRPVPFPFPSRA
jgi:signal peptidase